MAPLTRTGSQTSGKVGKPVHRKRPVRQDPPDEWQFSLDGERREPRANSTRNTRNSQPTQIETPDADVTSDVEQAVAPLRAMADRVGKEVEAFAETLDEFFDDLPTVDNRFKAAYELVLSFRDIANDVVQEMKSSYERELRQQLRLEWSEQARGSAAPISSGPFASSTSTALNAKNADKVKELRSWQQEADIWDLFRIMLELHPFEDEAQKRRTEIEETLEKMGPAHRYTSEGELWERFLLEDDLARERDQIKQWLERTAHHQQSDLASIQEELEAKAGTGKGLWTSGWLHTRERIKGEKRLRPWPDAAASPLPQIRRSDNNEMLVTTLDPDAPNRQQRTIEKPDSYFERAVWVACWEMLRRGMSWQEICDWCEERKEGWRAVLVGAALERADPSSSTAAFRRVCRMAAQSGYGTDHEAAVFGLLGGDIKAVERICRTVDDRLYAYYNGILLKQFDNYLLSQCPEKAAPPSWQHGMALEVSQDSDDAYAAILELISRLRKVPTTSKEAVQPMKIIQSYLLADEVGSLIHTVGAAIAESAALQGPEELIFLRDRQARQDGIPEPETEVALDPQTLRIAAHMSIVLRALNPTYFAELEGDELLEDENVLVAYIQALRAAGKRDLVPMYAARLQRERYIIVLGRFLQDIPTIEEQERILGLMERYDLDTISILTENLKWMVEHSIEKGSRPRSLHMLERTADTKLHPGQKIITNWLPDELLPGDEPMARSLQWFIHIAGGWKILFEALSISVRRALVTGHITCARLIVMNYPYSDIASKKSYEVLGRHVNFFDLNNKEPYDEEDAALWEIMTQQSRTYYELSQLVTALEALSSWRVEEEKYITKIPKPSTVPSALKQAYTQVRVSMEPILKGILLNPTDDEEAGDLDYIRQNYLPEMLIAYNTVLHAAGNLITRDSLLDSMELSAAIANGKSADDGQDNGLRECFVRAGRMRELVQSFALTSKAMLVLKAEGKEWKARRERKGMDLGMWEIGRLQQGDEEDEEDLTEVA